MRVLLTGSSGWLGRFLAPRLRAKGHEIVGLDVAPGADTDIVGSVADRPLVDRLFSEKGIEAIVAELGFRCRIGFAEVLRALERGEALPFAHDPDYVSPKERPAAIAPGDAAAR